MKKTIIIISALLAFSLSAGAQSKLFKLGQAVEVNTAILQELNRTYVDTLPVQRMTQAGIDSPPSIRIRYMSPKRKTRTSS